MNLIDIRLTERNLKRTELTSGVLPPQGPLTQQVQGKIERISSIRTKGLGEWQHCIRLPKRRSKLDSVKKPRVTLLAKLNCMRLAEKRVSL